MGDALSAMLISGAVLLAVSVLILFISIVAVKRGEAAMHEESKHSGHQH